MENKSETTYGKVVVVQNAQYQWGVTDTDGNVIVPFGKYAWIDGFDQGLARVRSLEGILVTKDTKSAKVDDDPGTKGTNSVKIVSDRESEVDFGLTVLDIANERRKYPELFAKWGIINEAGEEVLPVEYDSVWKFLGKNRFSTKVEKDGVLTDVYLHDLNPSLPVRGVSKVNHRRYDDYNDNYDDYGSHYGEYAGSYAQDVMGYSDDLIDDAFDGDPDAYWNID